MRIQTIHHSLQFHTPSEAIFGVVVCFFKHLPRVRQHLEHYLDEPKMTEQIIIIIIIHRIYRDHNDWTLISIGFPYYWGFLFCKFQHHHQKSMLLGHLYG